MINVKIEKKIIFKDNKVAQVQGYEYVSVVLSYVKGNGSEPFNCYRCKTLVFVFNEARVMSLLDARMEILGKSTDHICKHCKIIYRVF